MPRADLCSSCENGVCCTSNEVQQKFHLGTVDNPSATVLNLVLEPTNFGRRKSAFVYTACTPLELSMRWPVQPIVSRWRRKP